MQASLMPNPTPAAVTKDISGLVLIKISVARKMPFEKGIKVSPVE